MRWLWLALCGASGGVLAGMGMGGGTLTIPLLVLLLSVSVALGMHLKNGLAELSSVPYILIPALAATAVTSFFAEEAGELLGKLYGGFLILIALAGLTGGVKRGG